MTNLSSCNRPRAALWRSRTRTGLRARSETGRCLQQRPARATRPAYAGGQRTRARRKRGCCGLLRTRAAGLRGRPSHAAAAHRRAQARAAGGSLAPAPAVPPQRAARRPDGLQMDERAGLGAQRRAPELGPVAPDLHRRLARAAARCAPRHDRTPPGMLPRSVRPAQACGLVRPRRPVVTPASGLASACPPPNPASLEGDWGDEVRQACIWGAATCAVVAASPLTGKVRPGRPAALQPSLAHHAPPLSPPMALPSSWCLGAAQGAPLTHPLLPCPWCLSQPTDHHPYPQGKTTA